MVQNSCASHFPKDRGTSSSGGSGNAGSPSEPGVARNGTKCGPGVRQFTFSPYAPTCLAEFKGNNGGATSHGVDAKTITLAFRRTNDYDTAAPAVGASSQAAIEADLITLTNYFNSQYELYGRKVVVKTPRRERNRYRRVAAHTHRRHQRDDQCWRRPRDHGGSCANDYGRRGASGNRRRRSDHQCRRESVGHVGEQAVCDGRRCGFHECGRG